jgi:hypothetical protein
MKNLTKNLIALFTISLFIVMACKTVEDVKPTIAPTLKTGIATDITGNTAKVSGSISVVGTLSISDYGVVYGTSSTPTLSDSKMSLGSLAAPKDFTTDLSGLSQNTSYNFRVYVTNSGGTVYGDAVAFKTLELKAPTSTTGTSSVITQNGFTMDGKLTDIGTSAVTDFGHCISETNQMPTIADTKTSMGAASGAKDFKSVFANLKAGTTYYVRSFATNGVGTAYGDKVEVKTTMVSAPTVTTGVSSAVAATTATMAGSVKAIGTENITQYGHVWSSTNATPTIADSKTSLGALTTAKDFTSNLTGLTAATTYNVRSYATNSVGTAYGDVVQFKTDVVKTITIDCGKIPDVWEDLGDGVDYIVKCQIYISDKVITIKPGVKIQFDGGSAGIEVQFNSQGALNMIGTAAKPIILEGKESSQGYWKGIVVNSTKQENKWEYVTLQDAGNSSDGGLCVGYKAWVSVKNCTFNNNKGYGIKKNDTGFANRGIYGFESNTFKNNTKSALVIASTDLGVLDSKSSYLNNGRKFIEVVNGQYATYDDDITIQKLDVPYRFSNFIVNSRTTVNAGVSFEFSTDGMVELRDKSAALIANGTASDPIKFSGSLAGKGTWAGLLFDNRNIENKLNYCTIDGAGSATLSTTNFNYWYEKNGKAAIVIDGTDYKGSYRMAVTNCTISNSGGYGIAYSIYSKDAVTIKDNTYKDNAKANVIEFSY